MFRSMMNSASFSGALGNNLTPKKTIQDGAFIDSKEDEGSVVDDIAVEAALLEAAYDDEDLQKFNSLSLPDDKSKKS